MTGRVSLERHQRIGVLRIDNPPVNALSIDVICGVGEAFDEFERDRSLAALVMHCDGRTFVVGGDIAVLDIPDFSPAPFNRTLARIEKCDRPTVAVLHGTALGGGFELALACHYRIALPGTRVGLPEIKLGLLPGSHGTQRVPRLTGAEFALDMMLSGRMIDAPTALARGLIDAIVEGEPLEAGVDYAARLVKRGAPLRRISDVRPDSGSLPAGFFARALADVTIRLAAYPAAKALVRAVEAAVTLPYAEGAAVEAELFEICRRSPESRALRHLFRAERETAKVPLEPRSMTPRRIRSIGVLGAGMMGAGISIAFANAGFPVVVVEASREALDRGLGTVRKYYETSAAKGKLTPEQARDHIASIHGTVDDAALASCDLVVEAVYEDLNLKKAVFARLGAVCKPGAIIASNTSTLDLDVLAEATGRAGDVVGMHFFSPAHIMRLLEVVRGAKTAPDVLATALKVASAIKKTPVVSGVCYGFIGNRMAEPYLREADSLLLEGASPEQIDGAIESLGMAMGPCRMLDMAGVDVAAKVLVERERAGQLQPDPCYRPVVRKLYELGRLGQKTGAGYYRYDGRARMPDAETRRICAELADRLSIARRDDVGNEEIVERLLYPLINEGTRVLEEGIAYRPGDIDLVWVAGYGFPDHKGGPLFMADQIGLATIVERLARYARTRGDEFGYWRPSRLLRELAREGRRLSEWRRPSRIDQISTEPHVH